MVWSAIIYIIEMVWFGYGSVCQTTSRLRSKAYFHLEKEIKLNISLLSPISQIVLMFKWHCYIRYTLYSNYVDGPSSLFRFCVCVRESSVCTYKKFHTLVNTLEKTKQKTTGLNGQGMTYELDTGSINQLSILEPKKKIQLASRVTVTTHGPSI